MPTLLSTTARVPFCIVGYEVSSTKAIVALLSDLTC